jgi:hypothetical protein
LTEKKIQEIASYQFPAEKMKAHTVAKNFQQIDHPTEHVPYTIFTPQTLF